MIHSGVEPKRIFACVEPVNGDRLLAILRELYPDRSFPANLQSDQNLSNIVPASGPRSYSETWEKTGGRASRRM